MLENKKKLQGGVMEGVRGRTMGEPLATAGSRIEVVPATDITMSFTGEVSTTTGKGSRGAGKSSQKAKGG